MAQTPGETGKRSAHARIAPFSKPADEAPTAPDAQPRALGRHPRPFAGPPARTAVNDLGNVSATLALVVTDVPDLAAVDAVERHIALEPRVEETPAWVLAAEAMLDLPMLDSLPALDTSEDLVATELPLLIAEMSDAEHVARRFETLASRVRSGEIGVVGVDGDASDAVLVATFLASILRTHP